MDRYNPQQTWRWHLQHAPALSLPVETQATQCGSWSWCGLPVASPLGVPAGPLMDAKWLLHYANHGFDILVYKTVRSVERDCYPLPNLVPVDTQPLSSPGNVVPATATMNGSWAVSFGMPSQAPRVWREDIAFARNHLPAGKVLVVSVVGTQDAAISNADASLEQLAEDFARCAKWAMESGAHGIEANFSCPNVSTTDGQLYQQPQAASVVAERIRSSIGNAPLVLKIGRVATSECAAELLHHVGPHINGLAMTNSIAAKVVADDGSLLFDGQPRGICGAATRAASVTQTALFRESLNLSPLKLDLIGVGGISTAEHVCEYLAAGASSVAIATAAMLNPDVGLQIRERLVGLLPSHSSEE